MPKRPTEPEEALYVRMPAAAFERLQRAADALGIAKKDLVTSLVTKYVDPDSKKGLSALTQLSTPRRVVAVDLGAPGPVLGSYSFQPADSPEVMSAAQLAALLQLDEKTVLELAESGDLPGRKLGTVWRFSRAAVIAWLAEPQR
jgi:excisionase family DNA binding protein